MGRRRAPGRKDAGDGAILERRGVRQLHLQQHKDERSNAPGLIKNGQEIPIPRWSKPLGPIYLALPVSPLLSLAAWWRTWDKSVPDHVMKRITPTLVGRDISVSPMAPSYDSSFSRHVISSSIGN